MRNPDASHIQNVHARNNAFSPTGHVADVHARNNGLVSKPTRGATVDAGVPDTAPPAAVGAAAAYASESRRLYYRSR